MTPRTVTNVVEVAPLPGSGILRPFPSTGLPHLDPFVFLDTGAPKNLGSGEIYVGPHPHRGVQPVSLLFRGRIEHRDSLGHERTVDSGGMQWLVAGAGALHEEVLHGDEHGVFHMAQLWVNVPESRKMDPPEHHAVGADRIPLVRDLGSGTTIRLYAGEIGGVEGPAPMPTPVLVAHIAFEPGGAVEVPVPRAWTAAFTVVAGQVGVDGQEALAPGATVSFADDGESVRIHSPAGGEVLFMAGEPIGEPIVAGGGFVMTSRSAVDEAFADLRAGRMGRLAPSR